MLALEMMKGSTHSIMLALEMMKDWLSYSLEGNCCYSATHFSQIFIFFSQVDNELLVTFNSLEYVFYAKLPNFIVLSRSIHLCSYSQQLML